MPQGRQHIYFLMDSGNNSYYVSNSMVLSTATPKPLQSTPEGWRNIQITNQRNQKYFALDRSFSVPLEFVKDGAQILKHLYYNRGIEEKVFLCIAKQVLYMDATHYGYYYTLLYKGEIDFANFQHDGPKVTCNIMEGGPVKHIKAKENTSYEIAIDDEDYVLVKIDGVRLRQSANYLLTNGSLSSDLGAHVTDLTLLGSEQIQSIGAQSSVRTAVASASDIDDTGQFILKTGATSTQITIKYNYGITLSLASGIGSIFGTHYFFQLRGYDDGGTQTVFQNIVDFNPGDPLLLYQHHNFSGEVTYTIPANTRVFIDSITNQNLTFTNFTYDNDGEFSVQYTYTHPTSYAKALRPLTVIQKLIEKVTDGEYTIASDTLNQYQDIIVTCGDAIRGIDGAKIKTTLLNFFQSYNTVLGIGLGMVGAQLRLEKKSYWIDYTDPIDLGEVKNLKISPAADYIYNSIKIGYAAQEYEDVNGRQEFNNTHEYSTPVTRITKSLDLISLYRADCYGIEFTRINLEGKNTTDDKADNEVFLLHIKDSSIIEDGQEVYELDRSLNVGATGLPETETVFNIYLSPKHCLLRNGDYIHSLFYKQENKYVKFQTTEKNADLVSDVTENGDILIMDFDPALFQPNLLDAEAKMPVNTQTILDLNPLKVFTFTFLGIPFTGIPVKQSSRDADRASQQIQLLAAPDQSLLEMEAING